MNFTEAAMLYYEKITCRIAIQVCVGYFPDGRERHRTFSIKSIQPNASFGAISDIIRALAPVLAYPITKVRKVTKREIFFYEPEAVIPMPLYIVVPVPEARKIIPFPVPERVAAYKPIANTRRRSAVLCRAPPGFSRC